MRGHGRLTIIAGVTPHVFAGYIIEQQASVYIELDDDDTVCSYPWAVVREIAWDDVVERAIPVPDPGHDEKEDQRQERFWDGTPVPDDDEPEQRDSQQVVDRGRYAIGYSQQVIGQARYAIGYYRRALKLVRDCCGCGTGAVEQCAGDILSSDVHPDWRPDIVNEAQQLIEAEIPAIAREFPDTGDDDA